jgi:hypothetical protein
MQVLLHSKRPSTFKAFILLIGTFEPLKQMHLANLNQNINIFIIIGSLKDKDHIEITKPLITNLKHMFMAAR